jgi:hypothetical protein
MIKQTTQLIEDGKKDLITLLREKAYADIELELKSRHIDIDVVEDEDVEALVQAKVDDMQNSIKGFAAGSTLTLLLSSLIGI